MRLKWFPVRLPSEGQFVGEGYLLLQGQGGVDLLGRQQVVPLSDWPPRVGQHVGPVPQLVPWGVAAQEDLPHGVVSCHGVVVPDGDHQVHPLWTTRAFSLIFIINKISWKFTKHIWSFAAKQLHSICLNSWGSSRLVLKPFKLTEKIHKITPECSSDKIEVSRCLKNPNWFKKTLFRPFKLFKYSL